MAAAASRVHIISASLLANQVRQFERWANQRVVASLGKLDEAAVAGLRVERTRDFGESYLGLALWHTMPQALTYW